MVNQPKEIGPRNQNGFRWFEKEGWKEKFDFFLG